MAGKPIYLSLFALALFSGCQQSPPPVAERPPLPRPTFDGPVVSSSSGPAEIPSTRPATASVKPALPDPSPVRPGPIVPAGWIPPVPANHWQWIVVHHSATTTGSAATFDREHRQKGWDELGYHFVIGNGSLSGDGQIEVGSRWPKQKWGAHAKTPDNRFNDYGIGICLVGNFDIDRPTSRQLESVTRLVSYLMETYHIPAEDVLGHGQTKPTDCPGRNLSIAWLRGESIHRLADWVGAAPGPVASTTGEMLKPIKANQ
jgi:hypothetical protein